MQMSSMHDTCSMRKNILVKLSLFTEKWTRVYCHNNLCLVYKLLKAYSWWKFWKTCQNTIIFAPNNNLKFNRYNFRWFWVLALSFKKVLGMGLFKGHLQPTFSTAMLEPNMWCWKNQPFFQQWPLERFYFEKIVFNSIF